MIGASMLVAGFTACDDSGMDPKQDAAALHKYVDSVRDLKPVYTVSKWMAIDSGYQVRVVNAEASMSAMAEEDKKMAEASKAKYAELQKKYETTLKEQEEEAKRAAEMSDYRRTLRANLFGEGVVGNDMKFDFVTAKNIKDVYEKFVGTVADNKKNYTREDWDEIKILYEALDSRKNEVEKDLATKDNMRIAALKIKFASIKMIARPAAKIDENIKSKE